MTHQQAIPELPVRSHVQIVVLAMIVLAAFLPYWVHLDRLDRLNQTDNNQLGSWNK